MLWREGPCAHWPEQLLNPGTLGCHKNITLPPDSWRKSQPDSLQSSPPFGFHLQTLVSSRQAQTCTDGPSHHKVKITKLEILGLPFSLGRCFAAFREYSACVLFSCAFSPSVVLVGHNHAPQSTSLEVFLGCHGHTVTHEMVEGLEQGLRQDNQ